MHNNKHLLACLMAGALPLSAWSAGGHYPVDDADITAPGDIQVETWFSRIDGDNSEFAFLPAWTIPNSRLELTAGLYRLEQDGDGFNRFEPAAKWQFVAVAPGVVGGAMSIAAGIDDGDWSDLLVNFIGSYELTTVPLTLHGNLGWIHDRSGDDNLDRIFVGGAFDWGLNDQFNLIGQVYREGADADIESQLGLRFNFDHRVEHLDLAVGRQLSGSDKDWFFTVGLTLSF
jgi:hypothetical protein